MIFPYKNVHAREVHRALKLRDIPKLTGVSVYGRPPAELDNPNPRPYIKVRCGELTASQQTTIQSTIDMEPEKTP
jgi:hypothetical protein